MTHLSQFLFLLRGRGVCKNAYSKGIVFAMLIYYVPLYEMNRIVDIGRGWRGFDTRKPIDPKLDESPVF